ncbi:MAG: hypothetical protein NT022_08265 [Deltaproteobacteria bacterium]|nr:hypothetical protein [Deltaproteobacteria bacterium]
MIKIYKKKYAFILFVLLLALVSGVKSYAKGIIAEWEPFKTKTELELRLSNVSSERNVLPRDEFYEKDTAMPIETYAADKKNSSMGDILKFHNVSVSFSRMVIKHTQIDAQKPSGEGSDTLHEIKALPSTFFTSPYRDRLESIGKIFEPQVNLKIEF